MSPRILCTLAVAALALVPHAIAQRLIQFPAASVSTPQAGVYTLSPFASEKLIASGTDEPRIYQRNDLTPSNVTYWTIAKSGADALRIFDSQFVFKKAFPFNINAGAAAMSPDGRTFADIRSLKQLLLTDEAQIARNLTRQLTTYATGAPVRFSDRPDIEHILQQAEPSHYGVRTLITGIVQSRLFLQK